MVGGIVENLYVPLRRVPHVDIVCISRFLKNTGWAMLPVPLILVVIGAFIRNMGASDDKLAQVIGLSLTFLAWVASYLRQQRQWYIEYSEAREGIEKKLDCLTPKIVNGTGSGCQNRVELECSDNNVDTLICLAREGVSLKYSSMPLVPVETLSLYLVSRIYLWPAVRRNLADYWSLGVASQLGGQTTCGKLEGETVGRLIVEFEAMPNYMIKHISDDLENLMKRDLEAGEANCSSRVLAVDVLVRETIFSGGIIAR